MQTKRDLQVPVILPWDSEREVIENAFAETLPIRKAMRCGQIQPRLPYRGGCTRFSSWVATSPITAPHTEN